jgi:hypothetical protein
MSTKFSLKLFWFSSETYYTNVPFFNAPHYDYINGFKLNNLNVKFPPYKVFLSLMFKSTASQKYESGISLYFTVLIKHRQVHSCVYSFTAACS